MKKIVGLNTKKRRRLGTGFVDMIASFSNASPSCPDASLITASDWQEGLLPQSNGGAGFRVRNISSWRLVSFYLLSIVLFLLLFSQLWTLQVVKGAENFALSEGNRVQTKISNAPRGIIYDRYRKVLARNNPAFRLKVGEETKIIDRETALLLEAKGSSESANLEIDSVRFYPYDRTLAQVLGYTTEISKEELQNLSNALCPPEQSGNCEYRGGDRVGRAGLEATYESWLRGKNGRELIEVDVAGRPKRVLATQESRPGFNLVLALDSGLQKAMEDALKEEMAIVGSNAGAAIVQNPKTGEILGLVSLPSFNSNIFSGQLSWADYNSLLNDPGKPLLNRAIGGTYPPGSTFKIVSSAAGLETGKVNSQTKVEDTGEIYLGSFRFPNWFFIQYGKTEGIIDIVTAIKRSNDIFFYRVGEWVGNKVLAEFAQKLGLGQILGIDLPGEVAALIPTDEWKQRVKGEVWYPGDTLHMAIGQGDVLSTPLQITSITSLIANNGTLYKPYLVDQIIDENGVMVKEFKPTVLRQNLLKQETLSLIQKGMQEACATGGTGWPLFDFKIPVACKTGTAEFGEPQNKTHAWFTSYGPVSDPQFTVTVLIEGGGEGSSVGGPVARKIYEYLFRDQLPQVKEASSSGSQQ